MTSNFEVLAKITSEPPTLPPVEHAGAHILNTPVFERKYSKAYLGNPESRDAVALRRQIAKGAREALEDQYWDVMQRTVQARPMEARLGGDPSISNKVRAFLFVRYYKNGEWEDRIEVYNVFLVTPINLLICFFSWYKVNLCGLEYSIWFERAMCRKRWTRLFTTNKLSSIARLALSTTFVHGLSRRIDGMYHISIFEYLHLTWSACRLPKPHRDHLQSVYNAHMLHSSTADPFKLALYKLMGKLEPSRRSVPQVTTTTEDWLWFQLAMVTSPHSYICRQN
jgi:nuclear pore complex protein Nup93